MTRVVKVQREFYFARCKKKTVYCVIHLTIGDYHFIMTQSNDQSFPTLEINSLQARGS